MQAPSPADDLALIGAALRQQRLDRGFKLEELAKQAGLSTGFLSRVERGKASSSLSNLIRICDVLGVSLQDIFAGLRTEPLQEGYLLKRGSDQGSLAGDAYRYRPVAGGVLQPSVWMFELEYAPFSVGEFGAYAHDGQEILYMLKGQIEFSIGGERLDLAAGDCVQFEARQPHGGGNPNATPATVLMILTGHSDLHPSMRGAKEQSLRSLMSPSIVR